MVLFVLTVSTPVLGQWVNVAPALLPAATEFNGVACYSDGQVWVGSKSLYVSSDLGKTWSSVPFAGSTNLRDIAFYDKLNGLIGTQNGAFITHDGGQTWTALPITGECTKVAFNGSPNVFHVLQYVPDIFFTTTDGEATFTGSQNFFGTGTSFAISIDGTIWRLSFIRDKSWLNKSTDLGRTFGPDYLNPDPDCWSVSADSCDPDRLYLMNEDWAWSLDGNSEIYVTPDGAKTWMSTATHPVKFYSGAMVTTSNTLFATTVDNKGLFRSIDKGLTWKDIKGPSVIRDGRPIVAVNDNIIFVVDPGGSIWRTTNSGGDSLAAFPILPKSSPIAKHSLFIFDTVRCIADLVDTIPVAKFNCTISKIIGITLDGANPSSYSLDSSQSGKLAVTFRPGTTFGKNAGRIVFTLSDGTFDTVSLGGYNDSQPFSFSSAPAGLFTSDTLYLCDAALNDTITVHFSGCRPTIVSESITGSNPGDYQIIRSARSPISSASDSVVLSFKPSMLGDRQGIYELIFDNGQKISVPLSGFCAATKPLAVTSADQSTDTVGGPVHIPITVTGLDKRQNIELILHYENTPDLKYDGSNSVSGAILDVAGTVWQGRSKLLLQGAMNNTVLGYANFTVYADSLTAPKVWFDSLVVVTAVSPCEYSFQTTAISIISPPVGCGTNILSKFLRTGKIPQVFVYPNPTMGALTIQTSVDISDAHLEVFDALGILRKSDIIDLRKSQTQLLDLTALRSGVYLLRISASSGSMAEPIVIQK